MTALVCVPTALVVGTTNVRSSEQHLQATQDQLRRGILEMGRVLTQSHAHALQRLTLDNAFEDIQALVTKAVKEDSELLYGVYVAKDGSTLAFARKSDSAQARTTPPSAWQLIGLTRDAFLVERVTQRDAQVLGANVLEIGVPVLDEEAGQPPIGTIRYGF